APLTRLARGRPGARAGEGGRIFGGARARPRARAAARRPLRRGSFRRPACCDRLRALREGAMRYTNVHIQAFGHELPPRVVSSAALEDALSPLYQKLRLPEGRLELISGVRERRFWGPNTRPSTVSVRTVRAALERAGVGVERLGALVHTSVCRDYLEPATASVVAGALDLPRSAMVFDISNACLGFMNGLVTIANMIGLGQSQAGVVVATEAGEGLVDATVADLNERARNGINSKHLKPAFASL